MRRLAIPLLAVVLAALVLAPAASGVAHPTVRDVGPMVGFRRHESSYTIAVADVYPWEDHPRARIANSDPRAMRPGTAAVLIENYRGAA